MAHGAILRIHAKNAHIAGLFALSNRMAHLTDMPPNPEFHLLGRVPRDG